MHCIPRPPLRHHSRRTTLLPRGGTSPHARLTSGDARCALVREEAITVVSHGPADLCNCTEHCALDRWNYH